MILEYPLTVAGPVNVVGGRNAAVRSDTFGNYNEEDDISHLPFRSVGFTGNKLKIVPLRCVTQVTYKIVF